MRKVQATYIDPHASPPRSTGQQAFVFLVGLLTLPLLFDGGKLCYIRWAAMFGPIPTVSTPSLDLVHLYLDEASVLLRRAYQHAFRRGPWRPEWAVGMLAFSLMVGVLVMRHHRLK
ncbi:hypothetical protein [Tautonia plasticadhaerens]|uniref:Uncharacterized protein n=1 Tax=Tautonia plasticadhaerens TaxID=2527974 RepID=A0A518H533_9BACT|nr:hypothetical protein [Tautonia plasticadhaerens]QDV35949.1 hypothetical protein ElP_38590 [Tautonia plasticadhaerens]